VTGGPALSVAAPPSVRGVALVLHGGRAVSELPVRANHLAVLRMVPFARALRAAGSEHGLAVARLRFAVRGWNGDVQAPVADARWALEHLAARFPGAPVAIVGHSMGGRTALHAADHSNVQAVVGVAPWIEPGDPVEQLTGRRVLLAHGSRDRVTSAAASAGYVQRAAAVAASAAYVSVSGDRHAMLRRATVWHELTAGFVIGVLFGRAVGRTTRDDTANVLVRALAGDGSLVV
jgi:alpha-beta hydrolase superfamily lysophospholipase